MVIIFLFAMRPGQGTARKISSWKMGFPFINWCLRGAKVAGHRQEGIWILGLNFLLLTPPYYNALDRIVYIELGERAL